jgi:hypothetical protein
MVNSKKTDAQQAKMIYNFKNLTFVVPCIASIFQYISNKMQRYTVYLYLKTAVHVSGDISTHHQEHIQLYLQHLVFFTPLLLPTTSAVFRYKQTMQRCILLDTHIGITLRMSNKNYLKQMKGFVSTTSVGKNQLTTTRVKIKLKGNN